MITRASTYLQQFQSGTKTSESTAFIRKEMVELSPALLHGKTLEERNIGNSKDFWRFI